MPLRGFWALILDGVEKGRQEGRLESEIMDIFCYGKRSRLDRCEGLMATHRVLSRNFYRQIKIISIYLKNY